MVITTKLKNCVVEFYSFQQILQFDVSMIPLVVSSMQSRFVTYIVVNRILF